MKFPLSYEGPLSSSGNPRGKKFLKLAQIWDIRNAIHPQIQAVYNTHPAFVSPSNSQSRAAIVALGIPKIVAGRKFFPIARLDFYLKCELFIEMHVNHEIASLVSNVGDLDNRVKTLLDALRMPEVPQEIQDYMPPTDEYCCLLENDVLISALNIETFRHTAVPFGADIDHVRLNIKVRLEPFKYDFINEPFRHD